jgi:hypothetical protein
MLYGQNIPRTMTDVVPSPTSSSCVRLSSIIDCYQQKVEHTSEEKKRDSDGTSEFQESTKNKSFSFLNG